MYVILPFEKEWYASYGMEVEFVGHPLLDAIEQEGRTRLEPCPVTMNDRWSRCCRVAAGRRSRACCP